MSDTVGFIADLPTALIAAFRATLEEVLAADVILHVRDISHPQSDAQNSDVSKVLNELGIEDKGQIIEVWNKADLLDPLALATRETQAARRDDCVLVSAIDGDGCEELLRHIENKLAKSRQLFRVTLDAEDGKQLAWLHSRGEVLDKRTLSDGKTCLTVRLGPEAAGLAQSRLGRALKPIQRRS